MKTLRIGLIGLASAVAGFTLQGCFAAQPLPECQVATAEAAFGLTPYYVKLTSVDGAGGCGTADHMYLGTQRFRVTDGTDWRVGMRSSVLMDYALGYNLEANVDPSNDCANEEDCDYCVFPQGDGGFVVAVDGGMVADFPYDLDDGGTDVEPGLDDGMGGYTPVDTANECGPVAEPVERFDPADDTGAKLVGYAGMPKYPTDGLCSMKDFEPSTQAFQEEAEVDGTIIPAVTVGVDWRSLDVFMNAKVPGTAFKGTVQVTEGTCTANYEALGFWPAISCSTQADFDDLVASGHADCADTAACTAEEARGLVDRDCDPFPNLEQGRAYGSGISPLFEPTCNLALGICEPGVDVTTLK